MVHGGGAAGRRPDASRAQTQYRGRAAHYDELADSPLEIGTHRTVEWEQAGIPHAYVFWGDTPGLDEAKLKRREQGFRFYGRIVVAEGYCLLLAGRALGAVLA